MTNNEYNADRLIHKLEQTIGMQAKVIALMQIEIEDLKNGIKEGEHSGEELPSATSTASSTNAGRK